MFRPQGSDNHAENICWLVPPDQSGDGTRFKSPFSAKVRWDCWAQKVGCCRTMGPPPKILINCPEHFLKKHSRQVPVFFTPEELRVRKSNPQVEEHLVIAEEPGENLPTKIAGKDCDLPRPISRMGLFRHQSEPSYESRFRLNRGAKNSCPCEKLFWQDLIKATECAGRNAAKEELKQASEENKGTKDHIRANALNVIRMPARRVKRCYLDKCGLHLVDMSDSPYVLRPGFGKVPQYLSRRKLELYQNDVETKNAILRIAAMDNPEETDDPEKAAVIRGLREHWQDLQDEYHSVLLEIESGKASLKLGALKKSLERRMKEVEEDLMLLASTRTLFTGGDP